MLPYAPPLVTAPAARGVQAPSPRSVGLVPALRRPPPSDADADGHSDSSFRTVLVKPESANVPKPVAYVALLLLGAGLVYMATLPPQSSHAKSDLGLYRRGAAPGDSGDTAWMLMSSALVMIMTPGLALFYGGQVRTIVTSSSSSSPLHCLIARFS